MKPIRDTRRENLALLVRECTPSTPAEFARRVGKDKNQVLQWLMDPASDGARNIGNSNARHVEQVMGKPAGWLDADREKFSPPQSQFLRPDPSILHAALTLLLLDENPIAGGGPYRPFAQAERLADLYEWVERDGGRLSSESNARFLEQIEARRRATGSESDGSRERTAGEQRRRTASN